MKLTKEDYRYLAGKEFSNSYPFIIKNNVLYDRLTTLVKMSVDKTVLHVGCCDHIPLIENKIRNNLWLHGELDKVCKQVVGVDIDEEAVKFVNDRNLSKTPVICMDITKDKMQLELDKFDYVIMGEIVEHIDNPVAFLQEAKNNFKSQGFGGRFVITVPNVLSTCRTGTVDNGIELINSDHRFWFSPYTICKVLFEAGIQPEELLFSSFGYGGNGKNRFTNKVFSLVEKYTKKPSAYKSWRGDQIVVMGR